MLSFAHAMTGTLAWPLLKEQNLKTFLLTAFFSILPDFDYLIPSSLPFLAHRNLTHTIIPFALMIGLLTYFFLQSFWISFIPITTHALLDSLGPGSVSILPNIKISMGLVPYGDVHAQALMDGIIGGGILCTWILLLLLKKRCGILPKYSQ